MQKREEERKKATERETFTNADITISAARLLLLCHISRPRKAGLPLERLPPSQVATDHRGALRRSPVCLPGSGFHSLSRGPPDMKSASQGEGGNGEAELGRLRAFHTKKSVPNADEEGGVKKSKKLWTSFMEAPISQRSLTITNRMGFQSQIRRNFKVL